MRENPFRHCPGCGRPGPAWSEGKRADCPDCGQTVFLNPAAAAAALVTRGGRLLLARRAREPGRGLLDLPGGFIDPGEGAEAGLVRELHEELGLSIAPERLRYLFSFPNRYPYRGIVYDTCDLFFRLELTAADGEPAAADDVAGLLWLDARELDPARLAFDSLRRALAAWKALPPGGGTPG
jgi:ADP-ribose pyrophosphatase YjhB (NUDIX family)